MTEGHRLGLNPGPGSPAAGDSLFRAIFDNSLEGMLITSPDGRIHHANAEACRLLGMNEGEICQADRAGVLDEASPRLAQGMEVRRHTERYRGELLLRRKEAAPDETTAGH